MSSFWIVGRLNTESKSGKRRRVDDGLRLLHASWPDPHSPGIMYYKGRVVPQLYYEPVPYSRPIGYVVDSQSFSRVDLHAVRVKILGGVVSQGQSQVLYGSHTSYLK